MLGISGSLRMTPNLLPEACLKTLEKRKEKEDEDNPQQGVDLQLEDPKEQIGDRFPWRTLLIDLINLDDHLSH